MLKQDILLAHGNGITNSQAALLSEVGIYIACTPDAELLMASGADPVAFRPDLPLTCLGADCHSTGPSGMIHQMQMALSSDRGAQTSIAFKKSLYPGHFNATIQKAFNLATIQAARAIRMENQIGSIAIGKLADLVIFDSSTPSMVCAVDHDPLTAIVRHASARDIDTVIVGGKIRKRDGHIQDTKVPEPSHISADHDRPTSNREISWKEISQKLSASRKEIQLRIDLENKELARSKLNSLMGGLESILTP